MKKSGQPAISTNTRLIYPLWFGLMTSDYQWIVSWFELWTNRGVIYCVVRPCLSACGEQVSRIGMMVDGEGEGLAGSCRWTRCVEGRALGLGRGTRVVG
jgi:hypothetical protein